jgi:hypothetical protein
MLPATGEWLRGSGKRFLHNLFPFAYRSISGCRLSLQYMEKRLLHNLSPVGLTELQHCQITNVHDQGGCRYRMGSLIQGILQGTKIHHRCGSHRQRIMRARTYRRNHLADTAQLSAATSAPKNFSACKPAHPRCSQGKRSEGSVVSEYPWRFRNHIATCVRSPL